MSALAFAFAAATLLFDGAARAETPPPVLVTTADDQGQGFLMTRLDRCLAVTAAHVMEKRTRASLVGLDEHDRRVDGEATLVAADPAADLAVLEVTGPLTRRCGTDFVIGISAQALRVTAAALLGHVGLNGTIGRESLVVTDVGEQRLLVAPPPGRDAALAGFSGGLITVDDRPAAMILAVVSPLGEAKALRYDRLMPIVRRLADARSGTIPSTTTRLAVSPGPNLAAGAAGARVMHWSAAPITPERSATNLVDASSAMPWEVTAPAGVADVDLELAGSRVSAVTTVAALTAGIAPQNLPQTWEVLVSADGDSWALAWSGRFVPDGDRAAVSFPARRARYVRLRLRASPDAPRASLSIGALTIF